VFRNRQNRGFLAATLAALALTAPLAVGCSQPKSDLAARLGCPQMLGIDRLLARPQSRVILVDAFGEESEPAQTAALAIACHAAGRGERVMIGALPAGAESLDRPVRALLRRGARIDLFRIDPPTMEAAARLAPEERERAEGDARNAAAAASLQQRSDAADRFIMIVEPPDAARAPVGLSGHTWRPLGARLPENGALALRAERTQRAGLRVRVMRFDDVPERGAAHRYDGFVEVGAATQQSATADSPSAQAR